MTYADWRGAYDRIHDVLVAAQAERDQRPYPGWHEHEKAVLLEIVNEIRASRGLPGVGSDAIDRAEQMASGHIDYTSKCCIYAADLTVGLPPL